MIILLLALLLVGIGYGQGPRYAFLLELNEANLLIKAALDNAIALRIQHLERQEPYDPVFQIGIEEIDLVLRDFKINLLGRIGSADIEMTYSIESTIEPIDDRTVDQLHDALEGLGYWGVVRLEYGYTQIEAETWAAIKEAAP